MSTPYGRGRRNYAYSSGGSALTMYLTLLWPFYRAAGGRAAARRPKFRMERRPFLAPEVVIFGVDFTGPYILVVKMYRSSEVPSIGSIYLSS
jgi:hypothetical protein